MKKLNKKGFSPLEGLIVVVVIGLVVGIGFYAKNRIDNKSSKAESKNSSAESSGNKNWTVQTVYCRGVECHLRSGKHRVKSHRWVNAEGVGFATCSQTGIEYWPNYPAGRRLGNNDSGHCLFR